MNGRPITRAQQDLALAERLVCEVEAEPEEVRRIRDQIAARVRAAASTLLAGLDDNHVVVV